MLRRLLNRIRRLFGGHGSRSELEEEMAFHIDRLTEDLIREGMAPEQARRTAVQRFGSRETVQERVREERGLLLTDELARNLRFAMRGMVRDPVFSFSFTVTLALCIGFGTTVFSVVDAVMWRPLPYPSPDRLAHAAVYDPAIGKSPFQIGIDGRTWQTLRDAELPMARAVYSTGSAGVNLSTPEAAAFVRQQRVGAGYFDVLGVRPLRGREFDASEDVVDGPAVVVLSHRLWADVLGGAELLGQTIRLKGEAHTVVGIMPPEFESDADPDLWTPLRASTSGEGGGVNYAALVRVPDGISFEEADARLGSLRPPGQEAGTQRYGLIPLDEVQSASMRVPSTVLLSAMALLLLVGCANLAGLQIARTLARQAEMATRRALGSGAAALARQLAVENVLLGVVGGAIGLLLAYVCVGALEGIVQTSFGIWQEIRVDSRAVVAAVGLAGAATLLFGFAPVLQARSPGLYDAMSGGARVVGRGGHAARRVLIVGQLALVTTLLFAAGLLVRSYGHLDGLDPGFDPEGVMTVQFSLDDARYAEADSVRRLLDQSLEGIRAIPGVESAAVSLTLPYERGLNSWFRLPGDSEDRFRLANVVYVTPGYFETLRIPVLDGRTFADRDGEGSPYVAVVDAAWVAANLEGGPAVGSMISDGFFGGAGTTIVGVVGNVQQSAGWGGNSQPVWETPTVYLPAAQAESAFLRQVHVWFSPSWVVRQSGQVANLPDRTQQVFRAADPELPVVRTRWLAEIMSDAFARQRFEAGLFAGVALFALLLAAAGLYGLVAHEVLERRTEIGLRMALGASPTSAMWSAAVSGLRLTSIGLAIGAVATVGVSRVLESLIWGVDRFDPVTLAWLVVLLASISAISSFVPASRIRLMDPARILREG